LLGACKLKNWLLSFSVVFNFRYRELLHNSRETAVKVAQNSFQHLDFDAGRYNHSLSLDATIMESKNCPIIGKHLVTILVTQ